MSVFYVIADHAVVGPMTGIELREATLAGIIAPDSVIGATPEGPWYSADQVGLFSEKKVPLPHPPGTKIPRYHVQGMPGAFQGPFKLRELIGFASRGMLPLSCQFQSEGSTEWKPITQLRIIALSVSGDLVLIDRDGRVHLRTEGVTSGATPQRWKNGERAPIESIASVNEADSTAYVDADWSEKRPEVSSWRVPEEFRQGSERPSESKLDSRETGRSREWSRIPLIKFNAKFALAAAALIIASIAGFYTYANYRSPGMQSDELLGQWICQSSDGLPRFGISFSPDDHCVIFNANGASWTGDFQWADRTASWSSGGSASGINVIIDDADSRHFSAEILPSDGYVQLKGFAANPPVVDGHAVKDLFVRRLGEDLQIGYLTKVAFDESGKHLTAAWMTASRADARATNVIEALKMASESSPDKLNAAGYTDAPVLSKAIELARQGNGKDAMVRESLAMSTTVNGSFLLKLFGVPQEARTVYPFEKPSIPLGPSFDGSQLVRYPGVTLMLNQAGEIQYLRIESVES